MAHSEVNVTIKAEKRIIPLGLSATDQVVIRWLERHGINPDLVGGYTITRENLGIGRITLDCIFTDPLDTEVTGLDKAEPEYLPTTDQKE